jgi:tetratricopeptide (TPR) repeat protein
MDARLSTDATGRPPRAAWITAPIPLLAFLGAIVEGIIGVLAFNLRGGGDDQLLFVVLVFAAVLLPLFLVTVIYRLITRHHGKLYAPFHFQRDGDFLRVLEDTRPAVERLGRLNRQDHYRPFSLSRAASTEEAELVGAHAKQWEDLLVSMSAEEFLALHSWYNELSQDALALLCLDIAIAKGMLGSKNFSFRSANLRHLGRLSEARHAAELALELDGTNTDAHYNLAKIFALMGERPSGEEHAKRALAAAYEAYAPGLRPIFPELTRSSEKFVQRRARAKKELEAEEK